MPRPKRPLTAAAQRKADRAKAQAKRSYADSENDRRRIWRHQQRDRRALFWGIVSALGLAAYWVSQQHFAWWPR